MKKPNLIQVGGLLMAGALACACVSLAMPAGLNIQAEGNSPTIHMDADENYLFDSVSGSESKSGSSSVTTGYGNEVAVEYEGFVQERMAGSWHSIAPSGYFGNTEKITGMTSISFSSSAAGTVYISWSADGATFDEADKESFAVAEGGTYTCNFDTDDPNYFRLGNQASDGNVAITSIDISFACVDHYTTITVEPNDTALGTVSGGGVRKAGSTVSLEATPVSGGSTFLGWYENDVLLSDENPYAYTVPSSPATIVGRFSANKYNVTLQSEDESKGTVSGSGDYDFASSVKVSATPKEGHSFTGWYDGDTKVSDSAEYTFIMPAGTVSLVAKFSVNSYTVSLANDPSAGGTSSGAGTYEYGATVVLTSTTNEGYSFVGWHDGESIVSSLTTYSFEMPAKNLSYMAKWSAIAYPVTLSTQYIGSDSPSEYGSVTGGGDHAYQSLQTAIASPSNGYAFLGWYDDGGAKVSEETEYSIEVPLGGISLTARFSKKYSVRTYWEEGGAASGGYAQYGYTQDVSIGFDGAYTVTVYEGYNTDNKVFSGGYRYTFTMPEQNLEFTLEKTLMNDGDTIPFGRYPQTRVNDGSLISALSSAEDSDGDGYIEYNGDEYLKTPGIGKSVYDRADGSSGIIYYDYNTYYFKVEPITWKYYDGILIAEKIIDASIFYRRLDGTRSVGGATIYGNNYQYSTARAYLNGLDGSGYNVDNFSGCGFIDKAFTDEEANSILASKVDNSAATTGYSNNQLACADTTDKIFLLSYQEAINADYGYSTSTGLSDTRAKKYTDYALGAKGLEYYYSTEGTGVWWLRSPIPATLHYQARMFTWHVGTGGKFWSQDINATVNYLLGLCPALRIDN